MPSKMTDHLSRRDIADNFALSIEKERIKRGLTQQEMANLLDLNLQAYKRIISGDTTKIEIYTAYKCYLLTTKLAYEFVGYSDELVDTYTKMRDLDDSELHIISEMVNYMLANKKA